MSNQKYVCEICDWHGLESEMLRAKNPFDEKTFIYGCPVCKEVDPMRTACDEPDCWEQDTCGTPTKDGYRRTCGKHQPKDTPCP
jgi:hypothetical protein